MIPMVSQIEQVASVRASAAPLPRATHAVRPEVSLQAAAAAARAFETRRSTPVSYDQAVRLALTVNLKTKEVIATLVNIETNEVIRRIPGDETGRAGEVIRGIAGQLLDKLA
jgi:hypothetical protein